MIAGLVLVALLLTARVSLRYGVAGGVALVLVSGLWLVVDKQLEGPVLLRVTRNHGLTAADLAGLVGLALGLHQLWGGHRR